jgi:hypothetical protein
MTRLSLDPIMKTATFSKINFAQGAFFRVPRSEGSHFSFWQASEAIKSVLRPLKAMFFRGHIACKSPFLGFPAKPSSNLTFRATLNNTIYV